MDNNYKLNVIEVFYSNVCIYRTTCKQYAIYIFFTIDNVLPNITTEFARC